jgi:hypothetical protein
MPDLFQHNIVSIHGVPRSGTSWLGQIFNSHPAVAYRYQPLFAYRFKDRIGRDSTRGAIHRFLKALFEEEQDPFLHNLKEQADGRYPRFQKSPSAELFVMKMVRYHHLLEKLFANIAQLKIIGIVRHPCAVINSWISAPREFDPSWDPLKEWRYAALKNKGRIEEFFGFVKWQEVADLFIRMQHLYPDRFHLLRYEDLVDDPWAVTTRLFTFAGLELTPQTLDFLNRCHQEHNPDPYSVFRAKTVKTKWRHELDATIIDTIHNELNNTPLAIFL